jgi:hypothetical protein
MTYEDQFYSSNDNDIDLQFNKDALTELKNNDKYYDKYVLPVNKIWIDGKFYKNRTIEKYGSGKVGSNIRNAVTGEIRVNFLVGSVNEDLFFKVSDAYGRNGRREPLMLFYDSPEQYENHTFTLLDQRIKDSWYKKSLDVRRSYN